MKTARFALLFLLCLAPRVWAAEVKLDDKLVRRLRERSLVETRVTLRDLPFPDGRLRSLDLRPATLFSPTAKITVNDGRDTREIAAARPQCFRGTVLASAESFAAVCVTAKGDVLGTVADGPQLFDMATERSGTKRFIRLASADAGSDDRSSMRTWGCNTEDQPMPSQKQAAGNSLPTYTAQYVLTIEVETDYELYHAADDDPQALTDYLSALMNAVAAIYERDLRTAVLVNGFHYYSTKGGSYPWTQEPVEVDGSIDMRPALYEIGDYYHGANGHTAPPYANDRRSLALYLSGRNWRGGIAWTGMACGTDFLSQSPQSHSYGHWIGRYAFCGDIDFGSVPDPNASPNYAVPRTNYFSLAGTAHEIGHTINAPHTHCIPLSEAERDLYNVTRSYVDLCWSGDEGCYDDGSPGRHPGSAPPELGTIMSYCHTVYSFFLYPQTRYTFGQFGEPSSKVIDNYISPFLTGATPPMTTIIAPESVEALSTGNTASVYDLGPEYTYDWSIQGGAITAGAGTASITFTAGSINPIVIGLTVTNAQGCGVRDSVSIETNGLTASIWSQQPDHSTQKTFGNQRPAFNFAEPTVSTLQPGTYKPFYVGLPGATQTNCVMSYFTIEWYPNAQYNLGERIGIAWMNGIGGTWEQVPGATGYILTVKRNEQDGSDPQVGPGQYFRIGPADCGDASRTITLGFDAQDRLSYYLGSSKSDIIVLMGGTPDLDGALEATPATTPPSSSVTLSASVTGGAAEGTVNYTFWWNCSDPGTSVDEVSAACGDPRNPLYGAKFDAVSPLSQTARHAYASGNYRAKVIIERGRALPITRFAEVCVVSGSIWSQQPVHNVTKSFANARPPIKFATPTTSALPIARYKPFYVGLPAASQSACVMSYITIEWFPNARYDAAERLGYASLNGTGGTWEQVPGVNGFILTIQRNEQNGTDPEIGPGYSFRIAPGDCGDASRSIQLGFDANNNLSYYLGSSKSDIIVKMGGTPDVTGTLTADRSNGTSPLDVTFTGTVTGGSADGTINYTFWWNCTNTGTSVSAVTAVCGDPTNSLYGAKYDAVSAMSQTARHVYPTGTYTAKLIIERGAAPPITKSLAIASLDPTTGGTLVAAGTPQETPAGAPFTTPLQVTLRDSAGNPMSGVAVQFSTPAGGASALLSPDTPVLTDASGVAVVTATANGLAGRYAVTATAGVLSTTFDLSNTAVSLRTTSLVAGSAAGTRMVALEPVPAGSHPHWTAASDQPWLQLAAGSESGEGVGLIRFTFDANLTGEPRTGTITFYPGALALMVTQASTSYIAAPVVTSVVPSGLSRPFGVAADVFRNLYIAETWGHAIRKWTAATGELTTLVGSGLRYPQSVAVDVQGTVYIADTNNHLIKRWSPSTGQVTTVVSTGTSAPLGVATGTAGEIYIADGKNTIFRWSGELTPVVTGLTFPLSAAQDRNGTLYVGSRDGTLKRWTPNDGQTVTLLSGLNHAQSVAVDETGDVYFVEYNNQTLKKWTASTSEVTTILSTGLRFPLGVGVDGAGDVYVADTDNSAIRRVTFAYVGPELVAVPHSAGSDQLLPVLPASTAIDAQSDQPWLTIDGTTGGVVRFSFAANPTYAERTAILTLLGREIRVRQAATPCPAIAVNPASVSAPLFGNPYSVTFTQSGGNGSVTFASSGALPAGMTFTGATLSGTPVESGSFAITITVTDQNGCAGMRTYAFDIVLPAPSALTATASTTSQVNVSWAAVAGADHYEVFRNGTLIGTTAIASFTDSAVAAQTAYVYKARAVDVRGHASADSNSDLATTIVFSDDPLGPRSTRIKAQHVLDLRNAVAAIRSAAGLEAFAFTDSTLPGKRIRSVHIRELRDALDAARRALGLPSTGYSTQPASGQRIRVADIAEVRVAVR